MTESRHSTTEEKLSDEDLRLAETSRPGPIYDAALRGVMQADPAATCRFLGIAYVGAPELLPTEFPAWKKAVDLLMRVGPDRLAHVEYTRRGDRKLVLRMLEYRCLIMRDYPDDELVQHIMVLGEGRVDGHDDPGRGFWLDLRIHYLREIDIAELLSAPGLAPLAALGRGSPQERARAYGRAIRLIQHQGASRTEDLLDFASVLATITLDRRTIAKVIEEIGMTIESIAEFYRDTTLGHALQDLGREEGVQQGVEQGVVQARREMLSDLLVDRFGSHSAIPEIAARLAGWSSGAVHAITSAATLDEVAAAVPPSGPPSAR